MNVRAAAARVITQVVAKGVSLDNALPREDGVDGKSVVGKASGKRVIGKKDQVAARDLPLLSELCYGTLRWYPRLALVVDHLLDRGFVDQAGVHITLEINVHASAKGFCANQCMHHADYFSTFSIDS